MAEKNGGSSPFVSKCSIPPVFASCITDQSRRPPLHCEAKLHLTCSSTQQVTTSATLESIDRILSSMNAGYSLLATTRYHPDGSVAPVRGDSAISSNCPVPRSPSAARTDSRVPPRTASHDKEKPTTYRATGPWALKRRRRTPPGEN